MAIEQTEIAYVPPEIEGNVPQDVMGRALSLSSDLSVQSITIVKDEKLSEGSEYRISVVYKSSGQS